MPLPTSYDEVVLSEYMLNVTRGIANAINFEPTGFAEAIIDTLIAYGVDAVEDATDIVKLRSLARLFAWRTMVEATSHEHDYSTDTGGGSSQYFKRNQLHANAKQALALAETEAIQSGYLSVGDGAMTSSVAAVSFTW